MTEREPTSDEAEGMRWFNGLTEAQRASWLDQAWKHRSPSGQYALDSMPSAADAWSYFKAVRAGDPENLSSP